MAFLTLLVQSVGIAIAPPLGVTCLSYPFFQYPIKDVFVPVRACVFPSTVANGY